MNERDRVTCLNASLEDFQANIFNAIEDLKAYRDLLRRDDHLEIFLNGAVTAHIHTLENIRQDLAETPEEEEEEDPDKDILDDWEGDRDDEPIDDGFYDQDDGDYPDGPYIGEGCE